MSHFCVPVLGFDPFVKHWVKVLTCCPCWTVKKHLFVNTHTSMCMLQTMSI